MPRMQTTLGVSGGNPKKIIYQTAAPLTATNVEDAINQVATLALNPPAPTVPPSITPTSVNFAMSPYTALPTDYILLVDSTAGAVTIVLGLASARNKQDLIIKDDGGVAATNVITVNRTAPDTIDGATSYPIDSNRQVYRFTPKAAGNYTVTT